ncbi:hypothetical protein QM012_005595 [Aureobasidium pullulans]|uniref:Cytochrome P450 n=1 Tax=Aureobasidium pullulans TaxID=5580 RepID=A0ABR0T5K7_AURPU
MPYQSMLDHLDLRPSHLLILIPLGISVWLAVQVHSAVWNVFFHPLRAYPGPLLARATSLWYAKSLARGTIAQDLLALHERYGDTVRITPDEVSFIDPTNWKQIYGFRDGGKVEMIKDPRYHDTVKPTVTILTGDRDQHSELRKMLAPPFSEGSLKKQEYILHRYIDKFVEVVTREGKNGSEAIDMVNWWNFLTFDIIGFLAYGEQFNCLTTSKLHGWIESSLAIATLMSLGQAARQLPYPFSRIYKAFAIPKDIYEHTNNHRRQVEANVRARLQNSPKHQDFLQRMVALHEGGELSFGTLWEHASLLTIGGSETTATLLAGATYFLASNKQVQARLAKELREKFASAGDINAASCAECPYLLGVIQESLRLYPPSPANHTRMVPKGGATLEGRFIEGGYCVSMPMYAAFQSSSNWTSPQEFAPERWIEGRAADFAGDKREALKPFSYGPRNCLGQLLANQEIRLALAKTIWHFDLELQRESEGWLDQKSFTFWKKPALMVKMTPVHR